LPSFFYKLIIPILNIIEKFTINSAREVNLVSEGFKDYFSEKYPNKKFTYYSNGVDDEIFSYDLVHGNRINRPIKKILYVGNVGDAQALDSIIPDLAFRLTDSFHFNIIGSGSGLVKLQKRLQKLAVSNVTIFPLMPREMLIERYREADILFLHIKKHPAFERVLPSKIFEYGAIGLPILAGVSGYSKKFLSSEVQRSATFEPEDVESAINILTHLDLAVKQRVTFIKKFSRATISNNFASSILNNLS
jgi:hypothetical protein